ncbi:MAG: ribonuclease III [Firmicutes bacterium]|nr:ribonuclease III [Bacillota bacterium]
MDAASQLCADLGLVFASKDLLVAALTHTSYRNEHKAHGPDNERLEFLGDAVLELCVSRYLYLRYPDSLEGELTRMRAALVCEGSLVDLAQSVALGKYLLLGRGEEQSGGRERSSVMADACEALLGALYLDQGLAAVEAFLHRHFFARLETSMLLGSDAARFRKDYKTMLQERVQRESLLELQYETLEERGPAHAREFVVRVLIGTRSVGLGIGRSKKEAEQEAARQALQGMADVDSGT